MYCIECLFYSPLSVYDEDGNKRECDGVCSLEGKGKNQFDDACDCFTNKAEKKDGHKDVTINNNYYEMIMKANAYGLEGFKITEIKEQEDATTKEAMIVVEYTKEKQ